MQIEDFHSELMLSVRVSAEVNRDFIRNSFVEKAAGLLADAEEIHDFHSCHFEGVGRKKRKLQVDGYAIDDLDGSISLLIAEFRNDDDLLNFDATDAKKNFNSLLSFVEEALDGKLTDGTVDETEPGVGLAAELERLQSGTIRFKFFLISDCKLNSRKLDWPESEVHGIPVEFHIWDVERFHRAFESSSGRESLEISFVTKNIEGINCLSSGREDGNYQAYLCMIPGGLLAEIYDKYGSRLLEGNVRSFLTTKGKVNSGIQETIRLNPEMFFAYNNGISATAESVVLSQDGMKILSASNLQIVNGGQTTASLANAFRNRLDLSRVRVQMKLSVLSSERADEMIPLIARYANSQNKVNDADFFANHPFHVRVEAHSRKIWTSPAPGAQFGRHWFYERARGQYLNEQAKLTKSQKEQFLIQNPKANLLTKTDVAKLENTWRGFPHKVSLGAQKNFLFFAEWVAKEWAENDSQFDEEYFKYLVSLAILFKHTEALVSRQPWYQGGYRANVVTYTLARFQYEILKKSKGMHFDLRSVWDRQDISHDLSDQLQLVAGVVFKVLTKPDRPKDNVTEWAKMERCWTEIQSTPISFNTDLLIARPDKGLNEALEGLNAGIQPVGFGLFAKTSVMSIDGLKWSQLHQWADERALLNKRESDLLRAAARIPRFVPSAKDCEKILKIKKNLEAKGFEF